MQSRMDRYRDIEDKKFERSKKNTKLYEDVYDDMYIDNNYQIEWRNYYAARSVW